MSGKYVRPPCIEYESKFQHSKLEKVKLMQTWDDGTKLKKEMSSIHWGKWHRSLALRGGSI